MCALKTDTKQAEWYRRYQMAMFRFLLQEKSGSLLAAARLGRQAVTLGLESLDVARLHEQALTALTSSAGSSSISMHEAAKRAKIFFAEVIVPVEASHHAARDAEARIDRLTRTLRRRTDKSSASARRLESATAQRQAAETALSESSDIYATLLAEAQSSQKHLRHQTRELLSAQEDERQKAGRELRNEVAQALIAIDLSLLALKISANADTGKLEKEIAKAQRLMGELLKVAHA